jgi:hypothetical protein
MANNRLQGLGAFRDVAALLTAAVTTMGFAPGSNAFGADRGESQTPILAPNSYVAGLAHKIAAENVGRESPVRSIMVERALGAYADTAHQTAPAKAAVRQRAATSAELAAAVGGKVHTH